MSALDGKVALITGGSRGIGASICRVLGEAGATVAVNYARDADAAGRVAATIGERASIWQADVGDQPQAERMVHGVVEEHGGLDVLVINGATWRGGPIDELKREDWEAVVRTSLTGAYNLSHAAVPALRKAAGRLVVMSSVVGLVGYPGDAAYASAKAGLLGFVRSLAKELGRDGVTVNAVAPGFVETEMTNKISAGSRERMLRRTALRRPGQVEDVAAAVRYLVCEAPYVTGHTLVVDGGFSL